MSIKEPKWWTVSWFDGANNAEHTSEYFANSEGEVSDLFYSEKEWKVYQCILNIKPSIISHD